MQRNLLVMAAVCSLCALPAFGDAPPAWTNDFFASYPVYRAFFPFGAYGGLGSQGYTTRLAEYMDDDRATRFQLERLRDNYLNLIWGGDLDRNMQEREGRYALNAAGRSKVAWARKLEFRFLPNFQYWFAPKLGVGEVFRPLGGTNAWFSGAELAPMVAAHRARFEALRTLRQELGDTMVGLVYDDEPASVLKSYLSIGRVLADFLPDLPMPAVTGPAHHLTPFLPHVALICTESYGREKWKTRDQFLEYYRTSPQTVVWNDVLTSTYEDEPTLPGWPDGKPTAGEMRLAYWQSLAGGAKGFVSYLYRMRPSWWLGDRGFFNAVGREIKNDGLGIMRETGRELTAIGPLLLSTRPSEDDIPKVQFECDALNYVAYRGPALGCGVLLDRIAPRRYVVVYNNNVDAGASGRMTVPAAWLEGGALYDLHTFDPVPMAVASNTFSVAPLRPGEGRIMLAAAPGEFEVCRRAILKHRISNELIRLDIRLRELQPLAESGTLPARDAERVRESVAQLARGIEEVRRALAGAEAKPDALDARVRELSAQAEAARTAGTVGEANRLFVSIEGAVGALDDLIECHTWELFGCTALSRTYYLQVPMHQRLMYRYHDLLGKYFAARNVYWRGLVNRELLFLLENHARDAEKLIEDCRMAIRESLQAQRRKTRVLYLSSSPPPLETIETYAWLYKNFPASLGFVQPDGRVFGRDGRALALEDADVIWMHAVRAATALPAEGVRPEQALPASWLAPDFVAALKVHLSKGRGLLLSGLAAMEVLPLEIETAAPDVVRELAPPTRATLEGFAACPGYRRHPLFEGVDAAATWVTSTNLETTLGAGPSASAPWSQALGPHGTGTLVRFDPNGFYSTAAHPRTDYVSECTWGATAVCGRVVARPYRGKAATPDARTGLIEYDGPGGRGKVLVAGASAFDLSPGTSYAPRFHPMWKRFVRGLAYNMLCYLGGSDRFAPNATEAVTRERTSENTVLDLSLGWKFKTDPDDRGVREGWYRPELEDTGWDSIEAGASWESQGHDYDGYAWYRTTFTIPEQYRGRRLLLAFDGADEQAWVYVDGMLRGTGGAAPDVDRLGWTKPFRVELSADGTTGGAPRHLAVRVHDSVLDGGLWKPVRVVTE
ncbi:MAG: hypothetical protein PHR35_03505 [Kiritimatiellae bacterium]|nr:hypothetical protein [Kiritimatiellia bacterium]